MVRDNVLKISGLLVDKIGGEPVKPYQPDGIWAQLSSSKEPYKQDHGEKLYIGGAFIHIGKEQHLPQTC